jgi:hypothetical protein
MAKFSEHTGWIERVRGNKDINDTGVNIDDRPYMIEVGLEFQWLECSPR